MQQEKFIMFRNRLAKVFRHLSKQAKRLGVSCYRVYDHDLPEFPFLVEIYEDKLYMAEYKRRHGMEDEEHERWLDDSVKIATEVTYYSKNTNDAIVARPIPLSEGEGKSRLENLGRVKNAGLEYSVNAQLFDVRHIAGDHENRPYVR